MKVGTDIVAIHRVHSLDSSFIDGVLAPSEKRQMVARVKKDEFLAGHFAAKEAFLKALGTGLSGAKLSEIEVRYREGGQPYIFFADQEYEASISHDGDYAIGVVIIP